MFEEKNKSYSESIFMWTFIQILENCIINQFSVEINN